MEHSPGPSVGLSVGLSVCVYVRKVYCGKTVDWIRMPFGMVSGVGRGMDVLDGGGDHRRGKCSFGSEFDNLYFTTYSVYDSITTIQYKTIEHNKQCELNKLRPK